MKAKHVLLLITAVVIFSIANIASARPAITWEPSKLKIEQAQGTQSTHKVTIKSTKKLQALILRVVPELQPWVSTVPISTRNLKKEDSIEITVKINIPPDAKVGKYDGVIQLRHVFSEKKKKTISKPLPVVLTIRKAGETILPPDPGEEGKETLLGIDSDNDGVRDDIQRYIYFSYPDNKKIRLALTQIAKEYQELLAEVDDRDAALRHAQKMSDHGDCVFYFQGEESSDTISALEAEILNTKERSIAYINYSNSLGGAFIFGTPTEDWKSNCNFDVDAIGDEQ